MKKLGGRPVKWEPDRLLSSRETRFIEEYLIDLDATAAALRAGLDSMQGRALIASERIQKGVARERAKRVSRTQIYGDEVLRRWWQLASADARELTQVRYVNCRYCWGIDHRHQFRDHELQEALAKHRALEYRLAVEDRTDFDDLGGGGFNGQADPCRGLDWFERTCAHGGDPDTVTHLVNAQRAGHLDTSCPACDGDGIRTIWVADSRTLSPAAAALYNGVKISKDGHVEVLTRDRDKALDRVAQHLGLLVQRTATINIDPSQLTDEQLEQALRQFGRLESPGPPHDDPPTVAIDHEPTVSGDDDETSYGPK